MAIKTSHTQYYKEIDYALTRPQGLLLNPQCKLLSSDNTI